MILAWASPFNQDLLQPMNLSLLQPNLDIVTRIIKTALSLLSPDYRH